MWTLHWGPLVREAPQSHRDLADIIDADTTYIVQDIAAKLLQQDWLVFGTLSALSCVSEPIHRLTIPPRALSLTRAVYGWAGSANWDLVNRCGKVVSSECPIPPHHIQAQLTRSLGVVVLPVVFISLCHLESVQSSPPTFFFLFDALCKL